MADLIGSDYRACVRLSTKDDQTLAEVGERCARVSPCSLPALLASGHIERIPENVRAARGALADDLERES